MLKKIVALIVLATVLTVNASKKEKTEDLDSLQYEYLVQARKAIEKGAPAIAITQFLEKIISHYSLQFKEDERKIYCARSSQESLYYMMLAASKSQPAFSTSSIWSDAYYLKGYALMELGKFDEAKNSLENALELSPANAGYLSELAHLNQYYKNWNKSLELFEKAEDAAGISSKDLKELELGRALRGQGYIYIETGELKKAKSIYKKCLKINSDDTKAQNELKYIESLKK